MREIEQTAIIPSKTPRMIGKDAETYCGTNFSSKIDVISISFYAMHKNTVTATNIVSPIIGRKASLILSLL